MFFMFVCNVKMDKNLIKKIGVISIIFILAIVFILVGFRFYNAASKVTVSDELDNSKLEINSNNYTAILKDSHDNIDKYVGKKIKFDGFIYRLYDFGENQFVLAREMIISSDSSVDQGNHAVVVGFLCEFDTACNFQNGAWVEVEGVIEKGFYHGDMPVVKVKSLKETNSPKDEFVYPPDDTYITTEL